jgi:ribosomal protein S18 acetylase RimI-like enzyme
MTLIVLLAAVALGISRVLRMPRGTWRYILGGAIALSAATQMLPSGHPLRADVAEASRNLGWLALGLVPVAIYAYMIRIARRRAGLADRGAAGQPPPAQRRPVGLVQIDDDQALARDTQRTLDEDVHVILRTTRETLSLAWRSEEGPLVGHLRCAFLGEGCEILQVWVERARRKQGIARRMVAAMEEEARARGATFFHARVGSWQTCGFFTALGFRQTGEIGLGAVGDWLLMQKDL